MPNTQLTGAALVDYLMNRFKMTREEALATMKEHKQG